MAACRSKPSHSLFTMACRGEDDAGREAGGVPVTLPNPSGDSRATQRGRVPAGSPQTHLGHRRDNEFPASPADHQLRPLGCADQDGGDHGRRGPLTWNWGPDRSQGSLASQPAPQGRPLRLRLPMHDPQPTDARPARLPSPGAGWALCSPGGGVALEPCECRQHRSRSSLLRRMPVRGEYTMAPKLRTEAGLGAGCGLLTPIAVQEPLASGAAPSTLGRRSPPWPRPSPAPRASLAPPRSLPGPASTPLSTSFWCEAPSPSAFRNTG